MKEEEIDLMEDDEIEFVQMVREENGLPRIITVAAISQEELPGLDYVWTIRIPYEGDEVGLPSEDELNRLYSIEEQLVKEVGESAAFLGHIAFDGSIVVVFRSDSASPDEVKVKGETYQVFTREDAEWTWHEEYMVPTPLEYFISHNIDLKQTLTENGDNEDAVRPVDFACIFSTAEDRAAFLTAIAPFGYVLGEEGTWEDEDGDSWCEVMHETAIDDLSIAECCVFVDGLATEHEGMFDGWASAVVEA